MFCWDVGWRESYHLRVNSLPCMDTNRERIMVLPLWYQIEGVNELCVTTSSEPGHPRGADVVRATRHVARPAACHGAKASRAGLSSTAGLETQQMTMFVAINDAMRVALQTDPNAVVFGEDVAFGGVFRCTMGLLDEFGSDRVLNMPINEQGLVGP